MTVCDEYQLWTTTQSHDIGIKMLNPYIPKFNLDKQKNKQTMTVDIYTDIHTYIHIIHFRDHSMTICHPYTFNIALKWQSVSI